LTLTLVAIMDRLDVSAIPMPQGYLLRQGQSSFIVLKRNTNGDIWIEKRFPIMPEFAVTDESLNDITDLYSMVHKNLMFSSAVTRQPFQQFPEAQCNANEAITITLPLMDKFSLVELYKGAIDPIPEPVLAYIAFECLEGLFFMQKSTHRIHRDMKPSNILLNSEGEVKISDFSVTARLASTFSFTKQIIGSKSYHSPERVDAGTYTANSDVWGLGLSLLEAHYKRYPYYPDNETVLDVYDVLDKIVDDGAPLPQPGEGASPEFVQFLDKCLEKNADTRPYADMLMLHPWLHCKCSKADAAAYFKSQPVNPPEQLATNG